MELHRELFNDLPPAEAMRKMYAGAFKQWRNADGFYILVQYIAEQYGETAYELAEEVFNEMGLEYDPAALRAPDRVRRTGYNFEGMNIYNIQVKGYAPEMAKELARLYNEQIRRVSYAALIEPDDFDGRIQDKAGLLVACNEAGQPVGFVHCQVEGGQGSLEMLIFSHGRVYDPVRRALVDAAKAYFAAEGVKTVSAFQGKAGYPYYVAVPEPRRDALEKALPHIGVAVTEIIS